ncbi:hypothetical protein BDB01DRAFT_848191 [Pilobolus umbonatus]|nr:hypothetical protein BDB01DRAFT_848191 [Pilobolus umbonatus]
MSGLFNDIQLPLLLKTTLSNHSLDQLSTLWAAMSKCKNNIKDGFRIENLSWRLWYKKSILEKRIDQCITKDIIINTPSTMSRSRSLPDLSILSQPTMLPQQPIITSQPTMLPQQPKTIHRKFYFHEDDSEANNDNDQLIFTKKKPSFEGNLDKPVSLLSNMLQSNNKYSPTKSTGLRRCTSRYYQLDQLISQSA